MIQSGKLVGYEVLSFSFNSISTGKKKTMSEESIIKKEDVALQQKMNDYSFIAILLTSTTDLLSKCKCKCKISVLIYGNCPEVIY